MTFEYFTQPLNNIQNIPHEIRKFPISKNIQRFGDCRVFLKIFRIIFRIIVPSERDIKEERDGWRCLQLLEREGEGGFLCTVGGKEGGKSKSVYVLQGLFRRSLLDGQRTFRSRSVLCNNSSLMGVATRRAVLSLSLPSNVLCSKPSPHFSVWPNGSPESSRKITKEELCINYRAGRKSVSI